MDIWETQEIMVISGMSIYFYLCPEMAKMIAQICKNRRKSKGIPIHNGGGLRPPPTKVGRPPSAAGPPLWVPLWMGISLLFQVFLHIWASILVTRMLGLPAGMPTPWQEVQHPSL